MTKRTMVLVEWVDSCSWGGHRWRDVSDLAQLTPSKISSVGFVMHRDKERIVLTGALDDTSNESGGFVIPTGCVQRVVPLGPSRKRK